MTMPVASQRAGGTGFTKLRLSIFVSDCFDRGNCEGFVVVCCCCQVGLFKSFVVVFLPRRVGFERVGRGSSIFGRGSFCVACKFVPKIWKVR